MTTLFLVALVAAWAVIVFPALLRRRRTAPMSTAERFKRRLALMAPRHVRAGRWVIVPDSDDSLIRDSFARAQHKRRRMLLILVVAAAASAAASLRSGGLWRLHLLIDVCLVSYVVLLRETKRLRHEQRAKVKSIASRRRPLVTFDSFEERVEAYEGERQAL